MIGRENDKFLDIENRMKGKSHRSSLILRITLALFTIVAVVFIFLVISNDAHAGDYAVIVQHDIPSNGIANVTPGIDYLFKVDVVNTGDNNTGEDLNFTVELDAVSLAAGWTVTPSGTDIIPNLQMGFENKTNEPITVRAPSDAKFEDTAIVNITVEVRGREGEVGCKDSLQLRANVIQVFDVLMTTPGATNKAGDPGENVSFEVEITNLGNGNDTFVLLHFGSEFGEWSAANIDLDSDESILIYYNFTIAIDHSPGDIPITLNATSIDDVSGLTYDTLDIFVHVNPIYSFLLSTTAPFNTKQGEPGESVPFTLQIQNSGTAEDSYSFMVTSVDDTIFSVDPINDIVDLAVDSSGQAQAVITITTDNSLALVGIYPIEITASSQNDPGVSQPITLYINITPVGGVEITPGSASDSGEPGDTIDYTLTISNQGNAQDTFNLTLHGTYKNWGEIFDGTGTIKINQTTLPATGQPGSFVSIIIRITISNVSGETTAGQSYPITVKAASENTQGVMDTAQVTTTVDEYINLTLEYSGSGPAFLDHDPNKTPPEFTFIVTNNGNIDETSISVNVDNMPTDWGSPTIDFIDILEPRESTSFSITFNIPSDENEGEYDMQISVSSTDGSEDSDPVLITVNITKPNLSVSTSDISGLSDLAYLKGKVGEQVTITARIHNDGHTSAENVQVKLYVNSTQKGSKTISFIDTNNYKDLEFAWSVDAENLAIRVEITPQIEIDESNNAITPINLDLRPDLSFVDEKLSISNPNPEPNEMITIEAFILNSGGDAGDVLVKFFNGTDLIGTNVISIDYLETRETIIGWQVPDIPGESLMITAEIDLPGAMGDGDSTMKSIKVLEEEEESADVVLEPIGHLTGTEDSLFSYTVSAYSTYPGDTLTFSDDTNLFNINPTTGRIYFTPSNEDVGIHVVKITVTNSTGESDFENVIFTIKNVNDPPILTSIDSQELTEDSYFSLTITATDADTDEILLFMDNTTLFDINPLTGKISFTPTNEDVGSYLVEISVRDESGNMDSQAVLFTVNNVNDPPLIESIGELVGAVDMPFYYIVTADDIDYDEILTFSDDSELFEIDPDTGEISFTPGKEDAGVHDVTVSVTDNVGESDSTTITITILDKEVEAESDDNTWILFVVIFALIALFVGYLIGKGGKLGPKKQKIKTTGTQPPQQYQTAQPVTYQDQRNQWYRNK